MPNNDNDHAMQVSPSLLADPHGRAALLLVESLIHGLLENATIDTDQAVEITERAINVQAEQAVQADGAGAPLWHAHALLSAIETSLRIDGRGAPPPRLVT